MKYRLLSLLPLLALVACAHPRSASPRDESAKAPSPDGVSEHQRISPLWGDPTKIDPTKPPSGTELVQILLENQAFPLKGTGCASDADDNRTLRHLLADTFGSGLNNNSLDENGHIRKLLSVNIWGGCEPEPFELRSGSIIDAWWCHLYAEDQLDDKEAETFTWSIAFGIRKDTWQLIVDSTTPNPLICIP